MKEIYLVRNSKKPVEYGWQISLSQESDRDVPLD
jgi:hypothetical protein